MKIDSDKGQRNPTARPRPFLALVCRKSPNTASVYVRLRPRRDAGPRRANKTMTNVPRHAYFHTWDMRNVLSDVGGLPHLHHGLFLRMDRMFRVPRSSLTPVPGGVPLDITYPAVPAFPRPQGEDDGGIYGQSGGARRLKSRHARYGGKDIRAGRRSTEGSVSNFTQPDHATISGTSPTSSSSPPSPPRKKGEGKRGNN